MVFQHSNTYARQAELGIKYCYPGRDVDDDFTLRCSGFLGYMWEEAVHDFPFPDALESFRETPSTKNGRFLDNFSLEILVAQGFASFSLDNWTGRIERGMKFSVFLDTPLGFALFYKGLPRALFGIFPYDVDTLMVHQLQPVVPKKVRPASQGGPKACYISALGVNWTDFFYQKVLQQVAESLGFQRMGIIGAANNFWVREERNKAESIRKYYDDVAERLGFVQDKEGNWFKKV